MAVHILTALQHEEQGQQLKGALLKNGCTACQIYAALCNKKQLATKVEEGRRVNKENNSPIL